MELQRISKYVLGHLKPCQEVSVIGTHLVDLHLITGSWVHINTGETKVVWRFTEADPEILFNGA